jgi:hypothetical protein
VAWVSRLRISASRSVRPSGLRVRLRGVGAAGSGWTVERSAPSGRRDGAPGSGRCGPDFDPAQAVSVYPGGFVRRVAATQHYDGARADAAEPAVIMVSGDGPVGQKWVDPSQPVLRQW